MVWCYHTLIGRISEKCNSCIAAFSICLNISAWALMFFLGFLGAVCVRVSNELGKGNARAAKFAVKVSSSISICIGVLFWILCFVFGQNFSYLFTSNKEVAETVSSLSILLAFSVWLIVFRQYSQASVAVGAGWQGVVAFVNVGCLYILGIPLGVFLAYVAHLSVRGMWIGMLCGVAMQSLVLFYLTWRTNWDEQDGLGNIPSSYYVLSQRVLILAVTVSVLYFLSSPNPIVVSSFSALTCCPLGRRGLLVGLLILLAYLTI
ncbi:Protein detoxification 24 [Vitis vinifera]|uniref:Protein detoxification 24 n=1 Tax=Vitis vinifera TaxID=29760 RepID=A0A438HZF8_VITVI|nr:Protein detoxification 24 [Vitis vinifera]